MQYAIPHRQPSMMFKVRLPTAALMVAILVGSEVCSLQLSLTGLGSPIAVSDLQWHSSAASYQPHDMKMT